MTPVAMIILVNILGAIGINSCTSKRKSTYDKNRKNHLTKHDVVYIMLKVAEKQVLLSATFYQHKF